MLYIIVVAFLASLIVLREYKTYERVLVLLIGGDL